MKLEDSVNEEISFHKQIPFRIFCAENQMFVHSHDCLELNCVERGSGIFIIEDREYEIREGDFVVINNLERHVIIPGEDYVSLVAVFDTQFLLGHANEQEFLAPFFGRGKRFSHVIRPFQEEKEEMRQCYYGVLKEYEEQKKGWQAMLKARLTEFLVLICRWYDKNKELEGNGEIFRKDYERIRPAVEYIHENFKEKITLEQLAERAMMSRSHFEAIFREVMKVTPFSYIQYIRIDYCALLLTSTDMSISEIAFQSGFNNLSYFNRIFAKEKGMTPREYRRTGLFGK